MALGGLAQSTFLAIVRGDASQAVTEFNKLGRAVEKSTTGAAGNVSKFKTLTSGAFAQIQANAGLMAAGAGAAIAGFAIKAANDFSRLGVAVGQFVDATGFTSEAASQLIEVAGDLNIDVAALEGAVNKMNKAIGTSPEKFEALGVSIAYTKDGAVDMRATFLRSVDAINRISDPTKKAAAATALFGRGWASLSEIIAQGSAEIADSMAKVDKSKVMSEDDVKQARAYRDTMKQLGDKFEEIALTIGKEVVPALSAMAEGLIVVIDLAEKLKSIDPTSWIPDTDDVLPAFKPFVYAYKQVKGLFEEDITGKVGDSFGKIKVSADHAAWGVNGLADAIVAAGSAEAAAENEEYLKHLQDIEDKFHDASDAADEYRQALEDQYHSARAILDGTLDYEAAVSDATKAVNESNQALVDSEATQQDQQDALVSARDAIIDASEAYVEMHGASLDSATGVGMQISSLEALAASLGPNDPLRQMIADYIEQLKGIQRNIQTQITVGIRTTGRTHNLSGDLIGVNAGANGNGDVEEFDTGGVVGGPKGSPQLILAHGGETVVPTHRGGTASGKFGFGGGGGNITIQVYPRTMPTPEELSTWVAAARRKGFPL